MSEWRDEGGPLERRGKKPLAEMAGWAEAGGDVQTASEAPRTPVDERVYDWLIGASDV